MHCKKIKSIKFIGKKQTYDLSVPKYHNFILSNGIVTHNSGKSSTTVYLAKEYINKYSFVCPNCGNEFFKNVYAVKENEKGTPIFYIPDYVKNDTAWIECPIEKELDLRTGEKKKKSGCGFQFKFSQRKRIKWDPSKYVAYDNQDVIEKLFSLPTYSPLICDEAVRFAASFEHNKTESRELKKLFTVIRPRKLWIFFNIPSIKWIDSKYREGMASFWLRMIERGQGVLFEADKGVTMDIWHLKELEKAMGTIKFFTPMDKIKRNLAKHPCYFDMFNFPELDEKTYDEYEMVRNAVNLQRQVEEQSLSNKDIAKMGSYNLLHNWDRIAVAIQRSKENRMTYNILANEVFFNPVLRKRVVSDVTIRSWVRGVEEYIKTRGKDVKEFAGSIDLQDEEI